MRRTLSRAIWRLNLLEYVILFAVALLSLLCGALMALLLGSLLGTPFRATWALASILIFVIPAAIVWHRELRSRPAADSEPKNKSNPRDRNG